MRRVLWIIPALSAAVLVAASGATADSAFTDPAGDGKGGPDVTAVAVTNDAAGVVTMKITTTQQADSGLLSPRRHRPERPVGRRNRQGVHARDPGAGHRSPDGFQHRQRRQHRADVRAQPSGDSTRPPNSIWSSQRRILRSTWGSTSGSPGCHRETTPALETWRLTTGCGRTSSPRPRRRHRPHLRHPHLLR